MSEVSSGEAGGPSEEEVSIAHRRLLKRVAAFPEISSHARIVAQEFRSQSPAITEALLHRLHARISTAEEKLTYCTIGRVLIGGGLLPYELRQQVYRIARDADHMSVALSFMDLPAQRVVREENWQGVPLPEGEMTLGQRKSLARMHNRDALKRLALDANPQVLKNLLQNPRTRENDVVLIAASRPALAPVLEQIALHPTWSVQYAVQRALIINPFSPTRVGLAFAPLLTLQDLNDLSRDPAVHPVLKDMAGHLRALRAQRKETS